MVAFGICRNLPERVTRRGTGSTGVFRRALVVGLLQRPTRGGGELSGLRAPSSSPETLGNPSPSLRRGPAMNHPDYFFALRALRGPLLLSCLDPAQRCATGWRCCRNRLHKISFFGMQRT